MKPTVIQSERFGNNILCYFVSPEVSALKCINWLISTTEYCERSYEAIIQGKDSAAVTVETSQLAVIGSTPAGILQDLDMSVVPSSSPFVYKS